MAKMVRCLKCRKVKPSAGVGYGATATTAKAFSQHYCEPCARKLPDKPIIVEKR